MHSSTLVHKVLFCLSYCNLIFFTLFFFFELTTLGSIDKRGPNEEKCFGDCLMSFCINLIFQFV